MTCYLVTGTPRSGTSLAAGILHHLGVPMGERIADPADPRWDFAGADEWNPKGYFEDAVFVNWCFAVMGWPLPDGNVTLTEGQRSALGELIRRRSAASTDWGVKSVGLAYVLPEFVQACPVPVRVVRCNRHEGRSIASWAKRSGEPNEAARLIRAVAAQIAKNLPAGTNVLDLNFDDLMQWPTQLSAYTGRVMTVEAEALPDASLVRF